MLYHRLRSMFEKIPETEPELIAAHVPFKMLKGKRILMTGGTGFVGHWMRVVPEYVKIAYMDRGDFETLNWRKMQWDYIIHLAPIPPDAVIAVAAGCGA